jgi:hypothetical protein
MKPLHLCAGLQSSGSTVVSWCFLQRADMDGVFDARNDVLPAIPAVRTPRAWCKITISSFRYTEMAAYYEDEGWRPSPLLVVRDVRAVFNSLLGKHYGSNGITAEEPPLRMRLRRFKEDYQLFRERGWPIIRYETLVRDDPAPVLRTACDAMGLPWDDGMLNWPKRKEDFAAPAHGSPTFRSTLGQGANLRATINPRLADLKTKAVPPADLDWMEKEFAAFNREMDYPEHAPRTAPASPDAPTRAVPRWENTRRFRRSQKPLAKIIAAVTGKRPGEERE